MSYISLTSSLMSMHDMINYIAIITPKRCHNIAQISHKILDLTKCLHYYHQIQYKIKLVFYMVFQRKQNANARSDCLICQILHPTQMDLHAISMGTLNPCSAGGWAASAWTWTENYPDRWNLKATAVCIVICNLISYDLYFLPSEENGSPRYSSPSIILGKIH